MKQYSITKAYQTDFKVKGSKFIAFLSPCNQISSADLYVESIREEHPTATHHCYAYRVNPADCIEYNQDDGEPSGTAGAPILNSLKLAELVNVICVVVRYYGGTKLGKSGLIDAYSSATDLAISKAQCHRITPTEQFEIVYSYDQQSLIDKLKHTFTLFEIDSAYGEHVKLVLECPEAESKGLETRLQSISHLLISVERIKSSFHIFDSR
ncbi:YigZ family protein [Rhodohalobacter sp. SW132]|uniref:IMPACT family protein n=1 Tax=Rhodohalobacter sp. SW132 TaxID=2293433 RepID=UPI000E24D155|nr:YigZ family protein [Rhodohalobacter sp. SW132]REL33707.1 YigZ family protein [Rhodohalobacter sp. SW132]